MKLHEILSDTPYRVFVDVDGVLADYGAGITQILYEPYNDELFKTNKAYKKKIWNVVKQYSNQGGQLWLSLKVMPGAMELWNFLKPYNPEILTATGRSMAEFVKQQKQQWIQTHFGDAVAHIVTSGADKQQYAQPNHILIDDRADNIAAWEAAGGIGIVFTNADDTIQQLKQILR